MPLIYASRSIEWPSVCVCEWIRIRFGICLEHQLAHAFQNDNCITFAAFGWHLIYGQQLKAHFASGTHMVRELSLLLLLLLAKCA